MQLSFAAVIAMTKYYLRTHWKLLKILKTNKKTHEVLSFDMQKYIYIFWKFIQCPIHWDKVQTLQKISYDNINVTKMHPFFFREFWLITVLFLIHNSCMNWSTRVVLVLAQGLWEFPISIPSFFIKVYVFVKKQHGLCVLILSQLNETGMKCSQL